MNAEETGPEPSFETPGPDEESTCRVCGLDEGEQFWEGGWPTAAICACCGNESSLSDVSVEGVRQYREYWVAAGTPWFSRAARPDNWDLLEQMSNIPREWR